MMLDEETALSSLSEEQLSSLLFSLRQLQESQRNFETLLSERDACIVEREACIAKRDVRIAELEQQLDWFRRQVFGEKSERRLLLSDPRQLSLGDLLPAGGVLPPPAGTTVSGYQRGKATKKLLESSPEDSGLRFDESRLPVELIELPTPELEGLDADKYEVIDIDVTYKLAQQPSSFVILKYERKVVKLKEQGEIIRSGAPAAVLEQSFADVSFLAGLQIEKLVYHQPVHRQHQRLERAGISLSRGTLNSYAERTADLLEPVYHAQLSSVLSSFVLTADETTLKAGRTPGKMNNGYLLSFYGEEDEVAFLYSNSRALYKVSEVLAGFIGVLLTDGLEVYAQFAAAAANNTVAHALCWTHTRRYFEKALKSEPELANIALCFIGQLYRHESAIAEQGLVEAEKLAYRLSYSRPVADEFFAFLQTTAARHMLLPSNPFSKAISYAQTREPGLRVFLRFPEVPLDTNHLERQQRSIALGRNNWKFCSTEAGARNVAIMQTLLSNCTLHEIDHYEYLIDVLQRIESHPVRDVHLLMPRLWKQHFAAAPIRSPLYYARSP
jgi:transposase